MLVRIDPSAAAPLHEQIGAAVRRAIADGDVARGDRLPSARDLARSLDVNVHTVLRAYADLRDDGLIELRRGRGAVVLAADGDRHRMAVRALAAELVARGRRGGIPDRELLDIVNKELS